MVDVAGRDGERIEVVVAGSGAGAGGQLGALWSSFMLRGLLAGALGLFALLWPTLSLGVLVPVVGVYCVADGVAGLAGAARAGGRRGYAAQTLISLGIGAILIFWPQGSLRVLLVLFGAWVLLTGISHILAARRLARIDPDRGSFMAMGIVGAVVGGVLILWPGSGVVTISWLIGIAALLVAGLLVYLAQRMRRMQKRIEGSRSQARS